MRRAVGRLSHPTPEGGPTGWLTHCQVLRRRGGEHWGMLWRRRGGLVPVLRRIIRPMGPKGRFVPLGGAPPSPEVRQCKPEQRASDAGRTHAHTHTHAHCPIVPPPAHHPFMPRRPSDGPLPPNPCYYGMASRLGLGQAMASGGGHPSTQYGRLSLGEAVNYLDQDKKIQKNPWGSTKLSEIEYFLCLRGQ